MCGFVLVPDCTIHPIKVLNPERANRARKTMCMSIHRNDYLIGLEHS